MVRCLFDVLVGEACFQLPRRRLLEKHLRKYHSRRWRIMCLIRTSIEFMTIARSKMTKTVLAVPMLPEPVVPVVLKLTGKRQARMVSLSSPIFVTVSLLKGKVI